MGIFDFFKKKTSSLVSEKRCFSEGKANTSIAPKPEEYVDLGLSVKWATCNIGASQPHEYGDYFAWGEVSTKSRYTMANSKTGGKDIGDISGNGSYDTARHILGNSWRMPTKEEMEELVNKCTWEWTTQNGVNGYKVIAPSGNTIFFPAAGKYDSTSLEDIESLEYVGIQGFYWSSTPNDNLFAQMFVFANDFHNIIWEGRADGLTIRPVLEEKK